MTPFTARNFILVFRIIGLFYNALSTNDITQGSTRCGRMIGTVSAVAYLVRSFSICLSQKTAETLFGPVTLREPFIRPRLC